MSKSLGEVGLGFFRLLRFFQCTAPALLDHAELTLKLAQIEWEQEQRRLINVILATVLLLLCIALFFAFASAVILASLWNSPYRNAAVAVILGVYALGGTAAWLRLRWLIQRADARFSATRAELARDLALIRRQVT